MTLKYQSPSTPSVQHDPTNLLVEFIMLNRYGVLEEYPWRKGNPLAKEWGEVCKIVRRLVKTMKLAPERLGWYIHRHQITDINYNEFGLVRWKINKYFPYGNLTKINSIYSLSLSDSLKRIECDRNMTVVYRTKQQTEKKKTSLLDIIKQLEEEHGQAGSEVSIENAE